MKIAIGLPVALPGTPGDRIVEWARRSEAAGFSSLGTIGRIVFDCFEELIALAAAAAVTERVGLVTTVMISPPRQSVLLAKQAASLDAISGGRLGLGLGIGWRDDDFLALDASFGARARMLEEQVATLRRVWLGEAPRPGLAGVGPTPARKGGPEILLGGDAARALERAGRIADGYIATPQPAADTRAKYDAVVGAFEDAGRPGRPRFLASRYFALGAEVADAFRANVRSYYAFGGDGFVEAITQGVLTTGEDVIREARALEAVGVDELFLWPMAAGLEQVERLADAASPFLG